MAMGDQNKNTKVERAMALLPKSQAMKAVAPFDMKDWAGILTALSAEQVDDLLLVLEEERDLHSGIDQKRDRQHKVNETRYLQRLEKLKIRMEQMESNPPENV